jgi:hypothetical protein
VTGESDNPAVGSAPDYLTIKYDASGNQLWVARYDGTGQADTATAMAVDAAGNVYVTGYSLGMSSQWDYATVKYDANGNQLWVARYDGPANKSDLAYALAVDRDGNVYVGGQSTVNASLGVSYYATVKYDASGNQLWEAHYGYPTAPGVSSSSFLRGLVVDVDGNVYVTGSSFSFVTWEDYATVKYDTNGNQIWAARYNGPTSDDDWGRSLALDDSGNVYVTGQSRNADGGGAHDYATVKYDANGNQLWVARYDGSAHGDDSASAIAMDRENNVYVTGTSPGNGTSTDYVTLRYDADGALRWEALFNGPVDGADGASSLALDANGNIYVTGGSTGVGTGSDFATIKYSQPGLGAGRVPGQSGLPGAPLTVTRAEAGEITLDWAASCRVTDDDYAIYEGVVGDFTSHVARFCGTGGATTRTFAPASGNAYYLVAPLNPMSEGSYGTDSSGVERPQGLNPCRPRRIAACP